jgi:hypothetical protein
MLKLTTIVAALFVATSAFAAAAVIKKSGCTSVSVEGCLVLNSSGKKYTLFVRQPRPGIGIGITVTGVSDTGPNLCMVGGPAISVTKWHPNGMRCPK